MKRNFKVLDCVQSRGLGDYTPSDADTSFDIDYEFFHEGLERNMRVHGSTNTNANSLYGRIDANILHHTRWVEIIKANKESPVRKMLHKMMNKAPKYEIEIPYPTGIVTLTRTLDEHCANINSLYDEYGKEIEKLSTYLEDDENTFLQANEGVVETGTLDDMANEYFEMIKVTLANKMKATDYTIKIQDRQKALQIWSGDFI